MNRQELISNIKNKRSFLCIGLDTDPQKIPAILRKEKDPVLAFNKAIIESTHELAVAYKPNLAFYESLGPSGMETLYRTMELIPEDIFTIADAKRADIGNTASMYAKAYFDKYNFDSITVAPYMGKDSVEPFLEFENKWAIVLGLTSNAGSADFQKLQMDNGEQLYSKVLAEVSKWGSDENLMFVIGATQGEAFKAVRAIVPEHFLLVPGVGAQGGDLRTVCKHGLNKDIGLLINSSRAILYASDGNDFDKKARQAAKAVQTEMRGLLEEHGLV